MNNIHILQDSDGDGIIAFNIEKQFKGVTIELVDIFDNVVTGTFYKKDLKKFLEKVLKDIE